MVTPGSAAGLTGLPTRTEQGDLLSALHAGHGEFPRIVMASSDLAEGFADAAQAFNYAERYQLPVIHLMDKALSSTTQTLPRFDPAALSIDRGRLYDPNGRAPEQGSFPRFSVTDDGISPRPVLGQPGGMHWVTGGEHTEERPRPRGPGGAASRMEKASASWAGAQEFAREEKRAVYGPADAQVTVGRLGLDQGRGAEAIDALAARGCVRLVQVRMLWPFPPPAQGLLAGTGPRARWAAGLKPVGQFARLPRRGDRRAPAHQIGKYNGRPFTAAELQAPLRPIAAGAGPALGRRAHSWE